MTSDTINAKTYNIIDVAVIDVEKGMAVPGQTVTIVGDRIDKIGAQVEPGISEQVKTINGRGLYLMPGSSMPMFTISRHRYLGA